MLDYYRSVDSSAQSVVSHEAVIQHFKKQWLPFLPKDKNSRLLDLGCGDGGWLNAASNFGYLNCSGVDSSPSKLTLASRRHGLHIIASDIKDFLRATSTSYTCVSLIHVLEHFPYEEGIGVLQLVRDRCLTPDGFCLIAVPNAISPVNGDAFGDITHRTFYTWRSLAQVLVLSGYQYPQKIPVVRPVSSLKSRVRNAMADVLVRFESLKYGIVNGFGTLAYTELDAQILVRAYPDRDRAEYSL